MEQPKIYIEDQVRKMIVDGEEDWYISAEKYVRYDVDNVEQNLTKSNQHLPTRCKTPIMSGYPPETDTFPELKDKGVTYYQEMVGLLIWEVDMGRVDILL